MPIVGMCRRWQICLREFHRNAFEQQDARAGFFENQRFFDDRVRLIRVAALHAIAADPVDRLRRQAHVRAHRYAAFGQQPARLGEPRAAFEFYDVRAGAHQRCRALQRLAFGRITHERQVRHDQRAAIAAMHAVHVIDHVVERDGQRAVVTLQHHAERIADENHFDAGAADQLGEQRIVCRERRKLHAVALSVGERVERDVASVALAAHINVGCGLKYWRMPDMCRDPRDELIVVTRRC